MDWVLVIVCLIGILVFFGPVVIAVVKIFKNPLYKKNAVTTKGIITGAAARKSFPYNKYGRGTTLYFHNFTMQFADGKTAECQSKCGMSAELKSGTEVTVKFNPRNPSEAEIKCFEAYFDPFYYSVWFTLLPIICIGLLFLFKHFGGY